MRITQTQAEIIKRLAKQTFGPPTEVYLFGSRADDRLRGGDIDLYIQPADNHSLLQKKMRMASLLQMEMGEQKFDIVFARHPQRLVDVEARSKGIRL